MIRNISIVLLFLFSFNITVNADERKSTISKNVVITNDSIYIKQLDRYRKIRVYLPPNYNNSNDNYPVLYMHDGQNLFDDSTSYVGEWGVDEILDSLYKTCNFELIVVGIDNGQQYRMTEYGPWKNIRNGKPEGKEYMEFIVKDLKPIIDNQYRTLSNRENTAIMGSSMGGLISHYAIFEYPEIFSKAGVFSPSFWYSKNVFSFTEEKNLKQNIKIYMLIGGKEGPKLTLKMEKLLRKKGFTDDNLVVKVDPEGEHNEVFWKANFCTAVQFLFKD
ncbi:MAG: alpha/beta hydrolase [Bacteroidales bacterium]|nr:alpha/beta hydrolase [Bacteroidales bacterium]